MTKKAQRRQRDHALMASSRGQTPAVPPLESKPRTPIIRPKVPAVDVARFKAENEYDSYTPTCGNCRNRKEAHVVLRDSLPRLVFPMMCKLGGFTINPMGLCNAWRGKRGATLDT